ncbi:MAG: tRNA 2-thiocytidine biosynthesis protein TtcA [Oscillospiraceae bacterium]|nr:tRNA 2-thiocytidine biosynthesis protein TtcA [Oscillospiraceae bacterium]
MTNDEIELSLTKTFPREILKKFSMAVEQYRLINPGDSIAVCISGGKDSMLMAKLFQLYRRHSRIEWELHFLVMDPGYSKENRRRIEENSRLMNIPIEVFETDIFGSVYNVKNNPCFLCSKMRRGHLYNRAKELGCNKIALGHHFDDVIETILMSMIYGGQVETMLPKVKSAHFPGMQLIRPMYLIRESEIIHWCGYCGLEFLRCACRFTEENSRLPDKESSSARIKIKQLIAELAKDNPQIEMNIFNSVQKIKLNKIMSYKDQYGIHSFLDGFDE